MHVNVNDSMLSWAFYLSMVEREDCIHEKLEGFADGTRRVAFGGGALCFKILALPLFVEPGRF